MHDHRYFYSLMMLTYVIALVLLSSGKVRRPVALRVIVGITSGFVILLIVIR